MVAPLVIPLVIMATGGLVAAGKGVFDGFQARSIAAEAKGRHDVGVSDLDDVQVVTHGSVEEYGRSQLRAQGVTIGRFADWLEKHSHLVERLDRRIVDGVEVHVPSIPKMKFDVEQARIGLAGGFGALGAAASPRDLLGCQRLRDRQHRNGDSWALRSSCNQRHSGLAWRRFACGRRGRHGRRRRSTQHDYVCAGCPCRPLSPSVCWEPGKRPRP